MGSPHPPRCACSKADALALAKCTLGVKRLLSVVQTGRVCDGDLAGGGPDGAGTCFFRDFFPERGAVSDALA